MIVVCGFTLKYFCVLWYDVPVQEFHQLDGKSPLVGSPVYIKKPGDARDKTRCVDGFIVGGLYCFL